ncbi:gluconokinase [Synechocystis sp. PCC 7509]|uniref:gluconokinase n=1 Tax=Synechocystis sp. PCC 7509 TaxID=927677 RepID=UPI0002AC0F85|nr:gluconokinase [Synechocystis sp. PCC 7509]
MIVVVMGVSGSGKSTIGKLLAASLNWEFSDADDFHSATNIEKMSKGVPLNDADRMPWLDQLQNAIAQWLLADKNVVLACSALKASYRRLLWLNPEQMRLVYIKSSFELLQKRLQQRQNHFMAQTLLKSQFDILEEPKDGIIVDANQPAIVSVQQIRESLQSQPI